MHLVGDASRHRLLRTGELFEQQAASKPDALAVTFNGRSITYRELSVQAEQIADRLRTLGVGPGVVVGICMDRCSEMVAAMLGVMKAGAAYLPIDPTFPAERIAFMQKDANLGAMISRSDMSERLDFTVTTDVRALAECRPANFDDLAYVLYTSGSTGKPKGVPITHRALTNLLVGVSAEVSLTGTDVFLATSTISFDISVFEIFAPLITGARLVIAGRATAMSGELLAEAIRSNGATMLQATPSGWRILLESGWEGEPGLKMLTAGEPLDYRLAKRLLARGSSLWNLYGPTEATIYATGKQITSQQTKITIGKALPNYTAHVLDDRGKQLAAGDVGELYLGGVGISAGYLNQPELTAKNFIPDPFTSEPRGTLYRTGDVARFLPNGEIELLGRTDNQIKLRGQRIELEEIEAVLDNHPSIRQAVVSLLSLNEDDQRLVAYVVARTPGQIREDELQRHVAHSLPAYMIPSSFVQMESFELTPAGKVDRKALPLPLELTRPRAESSPDLEQMVLNLWRVVLGAANLNADTNFFYAGGHSLLAVRVCSQLADRLGFKIPVSWLIEAPTARDFTDLLRGGRRPSGNLVQMQMKGSLPPIYLVHHLLGDILVYRSLAECFAPERPVYGIQAPDDFTARKHPYPLTSLASEYVSQILQKQSEAPYHLAGYSSGAVLAFEMARQLTEAGHKVGLLALIDGDIRTGPQPDPKPLDYWRVFTRKLCKVAFKFTDETRDGLKMFVARRVGYVRFLLRIRKLERAAAPDTEVTLEQALRLTEKAYRPETYRGPALLVRFHDEASRFGPNPLLGWGELVQGGIQAVDVPGGHITGMNPERAAGIACHLRASMEQMEAAAAMAAEKNGDRNPKTAIPV